MITRNRSQGHAPMSGVVFMKYWFWLDKEKFDSFVKARAVINVVGGGRFAFVGEFIVCETIELYTPEQMRYNSVQLGRNHVSLWQHRETIRVNSDFMESILDRYFSNDADRLRDYSWETGIDAIDSFAKDVVGLPWGCSRGHAPMSDGGVYE